MKKKYILKQSGNGRAFKDLIYRSNSLPVLPLTYKKGFYIAWRIVESGIIPLEECDVFIDEKLVARKLIYYYYGRPDYEVAAEENSSNYLFYPVCFLVEPSNVEIEAVFPFDSGAYRDELYKGYIPLEMDINEFSLNPSIKIIKGFVDYFFGDNKCYYNGKPKSFSVSLDQSDELNAFLYLLEANGMNKFDSRSNAIEIISQKPIDIYSSVKAIILPDDCILSKNRKIVIEKMRAAGIDVITYEVIGGGAKKQNDQVRNAVSKYLEKNNLF